jgi:hypothetical protein
MKPDSFWKLELLENTGKKLSLLLKFLIPLILVIPIGVPSIPLAIKAGGFTLALAFVGIFGTAVGLSRLREQHLIGRLSLLPQSPKSMAFQYLGINALFDGLQFLVPLLFFVIIISPPAGIIPIVGACYCSVIIVSNAIGVLISGLARSSGEGHLIAILAILGITGFSGIFTPGGSSSEAGYTRLLPFGDLSSVLQGGTMGAGGDIPLLGAVLSAVIFLLIVTLLAGLILRDE